MADDRYDDHRNRQQRDYDDRGSGRRDRDAWLDNRTGVGPTGRGYRTQGDAGHRGEESRSFEPRDYSASQSRRYHPEFRDQGDFGGSDDPYRDDYARGARPAFSGGFGFGRDVTRGYYNPWPAYYGAYEPPYPFQPDRRPDQHAEPRERGFWDRAGDTVAAWMGDDAARARHEADVRRSHAGKGPKGYKRSDARIQEDVSDRLTDDRWVDASHIEVKVDKGEVTLSGKVATRDDKRHAEHIAENVSGVEHVQNNLRIDKVLAERERINDGVHNPILDEQARGRH